MATPSDQPRDGVLDATIIDHLWKHAAQPGIRAACEQIAHRVGVITADRLADILEKVARTAFEAGCELAGSTCQALAEAGVPLTAPVTPEGIVIDEATRTIAIEVEPAG